MKSASLLVVDDDPSIRETLVDLLTEQYSSVLSAGTVRKAREIVESEHTDLALIDINLPDKSGIDALKAFKQRDPEMICLILTGESTFETAHQAIGEGADGYFVKPIAIDAMTEKIQSELEKQRLRRELKTANARMNFLLEKNPTVIYTTTTGGQYGTIFVSNNMEALFGYPARAFADDPEFWEKHVHPDDGSLISTMRSQLDQSDTVTVEYRIRHRDGDYRWVSDTQRLVKDAQGKPVEIVGSVLDITVRKNAEQDLQENYSLLESVMESVEEGILVVNEQGKTTFNNRVFSKMWRLPERIGAQIDEMDAFRLAVNRMGRPAAFIKKGNWLRKNPSETGTDILTTSDGRIYEWYARPQLMEQKILGRVWVFRDITEKRIQEEQLIRFKSALDLSNDGVMLLDVAKRRFIDVNKEMEKKTGYSRDELLSMSPLELQSKLKLADFLRAVKSVLSKKDGLVLEVNIERKDGSIFPVEMSVKSVPAGGRTLFIGIMRDITDRKKAEHELLLLNASIAASYDAVLVTDKEGSIDYANNAFERITGYTAKEAVGKNPRILQSGKHSPEFYRHLWDTILSGRTWNGTFINRGKNGDLYYEDATISAVKEGGEISHFVAIKRDITEQKVLEEEISRMREEQELFMRHELANILGPIKGYSELLAAKTKDTLNESQTELLLKISRASQTAINLVDRLRALQNIEQGNYNIRADA